MKPGDFNNTEIEGDDFDGMDAGIDKKNLSFLFDIVSKQMYRRPIPSIVREITSNCFDSHIEAKVDDPVVIRLSQDEAGYYISFTDVGVGMSPDRMKKVYSKWFSSTKRDSNDQIGMFGLGSKSPLAYSDSFFLTTVFNNVRYEYTIHKGQKTPRIDLILEDEQEDRNQTEVKIYIKNADDLAVFKNAIDTELVYFDNVYLDSDIFNFQNEYTVLDYNTFKFRKDTQYNQTLHIIIGKVPYPINWDEIGMSPIKMPMGLKFNIGDLQVTPERESVRYIDIKGPNEEIIHTKDIIKAKIEAFKLEIQTLYDADNDYEFEDYQEYRTYLNEEDAFLSLDGMRIKVTKLVKKPEAIFMPLKDFKGKLPKNLFYNYRVTYQYHETLKSRDMDATLDYANMTENLCVIDSRIGKYNTKKNAYLFEQATSLTGQHFFYLIQDIKSHSLQESLRALNLRVKSRYYNYTETNALKQYKLFKAYVEAEIARLTLSYDLLELPPDWLAAYNLKNKRKSNKSDDEIIVYNYGKKNISDGKEYVKPALLEDFTGFIIYGFEDHEALLRDYRTLLMYSKYSDGDGSWLHPKRCRLYKIAKKNEKYFVRLKNAVFIDDFMGPNKIFKKFAAAALITEESKAIKLVGHHGGNHHSSKQPLHFQQAMDVAFPPVAEVLREIQVACKEFGQVAYENNSISKEFFDSLKSVAKEHNLYDKEMYDAHTKLERYVDGLELVNYIVLEEEILHLFVDFLTIKGKKVADVWNHCEEYEKQLVRESLEKLYYLSSIYDTNYLSLGYWVDSRGTITANKPDLYSAKVLHQRKFGGLEYNALQTAKADCNRHLRVYKTITKYHEYSKTESN